MKERELIDAIHAMTGSETGESLLCGIGDDCAVVRKTMDQVLLYTMDTLVDSVHFDKRWHLPEQLGRKAVSVNVSDIAAMGGQPLHILFSLGLPSTYEEGWAVKLCQGVAEACKRYDCVLIGGDTVCSPCGVTLTLTVVGEAQADQVLYRHGAKAGDIVYVTGFLGLAAGGLELCKRDLCKEEQFKKLYDAHLDPVARVELGRLLAESGLVHAMMDLSDGLATDLAHICTRSKLGAKIYQQQLPLDPILENAASLLDHDPLAWMIAGGEDYELVLTAPPGAAKKLQGLMAQSNHILYPVGEMVEGNGVHLAAEDTGRTTTIDFLGFDHFNFP